MTRIAAISVRFKRNFRELQLWLRAACKKSWAWLRRKEPQGYDPWEAYQDSNVKVAYYRPLPTLLIAISALSLFNLVRRAFGFTVGPSLLAVILAYEWATYPIIDTVLSFFRLHVPASWRESINFWILLGGVTSRTYVIWSKNLIFLSWNLEYVTPKQYRKARRSKQFRFLWGIHRKAWKRTLFCVFCWPFILYCLWQVPVKKVDWGGGDQWYIDYRKVLGWQLVGFSILFIVISFIGFNLF